VIRLDNDVRVVADDIEEVTQYVIDVPPKLHKEFPLRIGDRAGLRM